MESANIRGLRIHYERRGAGPPLVLLHGIGSSSRSWRHQLAGLSDTFTVVAWDMRGYGASADPPTPYAMADVADDLAGLRIRSARNTASSITLTFEEMVAFLKNKRIAAWKLPERLEIRDAFPMTPSGKIQKYRLREEIARLTGQTALIR